MLDYEFWYDLASYANGAWKGSFTPKEVATNAYNYCTSWSYGWETDGKVSDIIVDLMLMLTEDGSEEANEFLEKIRTEIEREVR